jgi:hypothetical protein
MHESTPRAEREGDAARMLYEVERQLDRADAALDNTYRPDR